MTYLHSCEDVTGRWRVCVCVYVSHILGLVQYLNDAFLITIHAKNQKNKHGVAKEEVPA